MKELTKAEEQVMQILWEIGKGFVNDILEKSPEPKPAYNTVSTIVRILVKKGFVDFKAYGKTHEYFPIITKKDYSSFYLKNFMGSYFEGSFQNLVSFFAKEYFRVVTPSLQFDIQFEYLHDLARLRSGERIRGHQGRAGLGSLQAIENDAGFRQTALFGFNARYLAHGAFNLVCIFLVRHGHDFLELDTFFEQGEFHHVEIITDPESIEFEHE